MSVRQYPEAENHFMRPVLRLPDKGLMSSYCAASFTKLNGSDETAIIVDGAFADEGRKVS